MLPGHCCRCHSWLGKIATQCIGPCEENSQQRWQAEAAGTLLAVTPYLSGDARKEVFAAKVSELIAAEADGRLLEIERRTGVHRATVRGWQSGSVVPQLGVLLTFCRCLGVRPLSLLIDTAPNDKLSLPSDRQPAMQLERSYRKIDVQALQSILQQIAMNKEDPPPSMREIGRRLGHDSRYLFAQFPAESKGISACFFAFQRKQREQRLQDICSEVEAITLAIHLQGEYPSQDKVSARLSKPGFMWEPEAKKTWRATLKKWSYDIGDAGTEEEADHAPFHSGRSLSIPIEWKYFLAVVNWPHFVADPAKKCCQSHTNALALDALACVWVELPLLDRARVLG